MIKRSWRVSEADLHKISRLLGKGWWEVFAQKIGVHEEVENVKSDYPELDNQKYQLMLQWNTKFESKATYIKILKALSELNEIDALDTVCKLLHSQSEPGRPFLSDLEQYSHTLKRKYAEYKLKAVVDWPPPPSEKFVKLAMIGDPKIDQRFFGEITKGNVRNVLKTNTAVEPVQFYKTIESSSGNVILLEGAPGSGKSTMCWYICKQWGEGVLLRGFSHVLMIELRDKKVQVAKCLSEIMPYELGPECHRVAEALVKKQGKNVLVILEGWNELPKSIRKESIFKDLVTKGGRSPLQNAVVLVSSRSNTTLDLQPYLELHVQLLGFTPDQIKEYVEGCFQSKAQPHKAQELLTIIQRNPKLQENCYLPLMLIIVVHLYDCSKTLPESFCAIVIELALSCLYRYCKEKNILDIEDNMLSLAEIPSELQPKFFQLCELTYEATMEERYSF